MDMAFGNVPTMAPEQRVPCRFSMPTFNVDVTICYTILPVPKRARARARARAKQHEEEKKQEPSSTLVHSRFDDMQQQMTALSEKMDLLIALVSQKQEADFSLIDTTVIGGKKRSRRADSPISDITDPMMVSTSSASPFYHSRGGENLEVVMEQAQHQENGENTDNQAERSGVAHHAYNETVRDQPEPGAIQPAALEGECSPEEEEDFKMFIDTMLETDHQQNQPNVDEQLDVQDTSSIHSLNDLTPNTLFADPLRSKANPDAVEGEIQMPQTTGSAMVVEHDDRGYDEEAAEYVDDTPLTTAVEVTDATTIEGRKMSKSTKRFIAVTVILVLIAFIVWPCVVFLGKKKRPPPPRPPPGFNETILDRINKTAGEAFRDNVFGSSEIDQSRLPPRMRAANDPLKIALNDESYECIVVIKSP